MAVRPFAFVLLLLASALAGCSGDEGDSGPDDAPTVTTTPAPSVSASGSASPSTSGSASASPTSTTGPRPAKSFDVDIQGNDFVQGSLTVQKGDTVRWTQRDLVQHTVTADDGSFDSGTLTVASPPFPVTFDAVGTFPYHCEVHPGMKDTITVVQALPA